ncbi:hypothetical protein [Streptomyces sp. NPDC058330]|uniref:hypothetical protein n=1 Tax=Streptomyces sp. NPDC058330 TaxID=3346449 RepID=UPI0036E1D052
MAALTAAVEGAVGTTAAADLALGLPLYLAHGRADGTTPELWSLSEHPPSAWGACERELYAYEMSAVTKGFGS